MLQFSATLEWRNRLAALPPRHKVEAIEVAARRRVGGVRPHTGVASRMHSSSPTKVRNGSINRCIYTRLNLKIALILPSDPPSHCDLTPTCSTWSTRRPLEAMQCASTGGPPPGLDRQWGHSAAPQQAQPAHVSSGESAPRVTGTVVSVKPNFGFIRRAQHPKRPYLA